MTHASFWFKGMSVAAVLLSGASVSALSHADATLFVDDHIKVTAINGQELKQSIFQSSPKKFNLKPGQHVVTAKYDRLYNLGHDDHDYLRSGNISVAAELMDNQTYRLTMPNQPEAYEAAKEYAEQPTLAVQQGNTIIASQQSTKSDGGLFSGLGKALGGVFNGGGDAEAQNQSVIASLESNGTQPIAPLAAAKTTNTLDSFMQLWLQATPAEREKMRQWIEE